MSPPQRTAPAKRAGGKPRPDGEPLVLDLPVPADDAPAWQVAEHEDDHRILAGTASWTDPTMTAEGVFYPRGADTAEERLRYYSSLYPLVEVDATYYALPSDRVAAAWAKRTPDGFTFDVKAHALMTQHPTEVKRLPKTIQNMLEGEDRDKARVYLRDLPDEAKEAVFGFFRDGLEPLVKAGKLGAVLLQFPPWFFPSHEAREHIVEVRERLAMPVTVEFRHGSWFNEKNRDRTLDFLSKNALPYVIVDEPQGFKSSVPSVLEVTSPDLAIVRFHGRNAETWEKKGLTPAERFRYLYGENELAEWVPKVRQVAQKAKETHLLFNNCYANYGTTNARQLAELLL
jgi:uncharacterized protein YecE (DUF72 family)